MDLAKPITDPGLKPHVASPETPLGIEWLAWLSSYAWDWFLTITFRDLVPMHRQESVLHAVGETLRHSHVIDRLFLISEAHKSQTLHLHGLYASGALPFVKPFQQSDIWRVLYDRFGRSKVEVPRGTAEVARYVTKYCLKDGGYYELFSESRGSDMSKSV